MALATDPHVEQLGLAAGAGGLAHDVGVGFHLAPDHHLALPEGALDDEAVERPRRGSAVNITPARSTGTMACTTTAMAGSAVAQRVVR